MNEEYSNAPTGFKSEDGRDLNYPTTPPIHSDPANGGKYADLQMQMEHRGPYSGHAGESKNQGLMNYLKANPDNFSSVIPPTPQTGRIYTERDLMEFAGMCRIGWAITSDKYETIPQLLDQYLKSKP